MLTIALSKGRLLEESLPLLEKVGIPLAVSPDDTRQLILPSTTNGVQFLVLRASDVPTFVRHGAAQLGIAGKDMLLEQDCHDIFQPCDLPIGFCRLSMAAHKDKPIAPLAGRVLTIATKYPNITQEWFAQKKQTVHIVKLYGSMEIAPVVGLSDGIVDLVSSGATLRDNHLVEVEKIVDINARLLVNRASLKTQHEKLRPLIEAFCALTRPAL